MVKIEEATELAQRLYEKAKLEANGINAEEVIGGLEIGLSNSELKDASLNAESVIYFYDPQANERIGHICFGENGSRQPRAHFCLEPGRRAPENLRYFKSEERPNVLFGTE